VYRSDNLLWQSTTKNGSYNTYWVETGFKDFQALIQWNSMTLTDQLDFQVILRPRILFKKSSTLSNFQESTRIGNLLLVVCAQPAVSEIQPYIREKSHFYISPALTYSININPRFCQGTRHDKTRMTGLLVTKLLVIY